MEEKNSYFPEEIEKFYRAYEEFKRCLERTSIPPSDDIEDNSIWEELKKARENYVLTVPKNLRQKLTGLLLD